MQVRTFDSKFVSVDEIENHHPPHQTNIEKVLKPENVVVYCLSKAKASVVHNQQATTNIISIVRQGKLPDNSRREAFLDKKRISGDDRTGFPDLPCRKLSDFDGMGPLYEMVKRW